MKYKIISHLLLPTKYICINSHLKQCHKKLDVEHMTKQQILYAALIKRCETEIKMWIKESNAGMMAIVECRSHKNSREWGTVGPLDKE